MLDRFEIVCSSSYFHIADTEKCFFENTRQTLQLHPRKPKKMLAPTTALSSSANESINIDNNINDNINKQYY